MTKIIEKGTYGETLIYGYDVNSFEYMLEELQKEFEDLNSLKIDSDLARQFSVPENFIRMFRNDSLHFLIKKAIKEYHGEE